MKMTLSSALYPRTYNKESDGIKMVIVLVLLYGGIYMLSRELARCTQITWLTGAAMLLYMILLLFFAFVKKGRTRELVQLPDLKKAKNCLFFLPPLSFAAVNIALAPTAELSLGDVMLIVSAAMGEELLFRMYLPTRLGKGWMTPYLRSSAIFALLHIDSYLADGGALSAAHMFCAFCMGACLCAIYAATDSLLLCFIIHAVINFTGWRSGGASENIILLYVCGAASLLYAVYLFHRYKQHKKGAVASQRNKKTEKS